MKKKAMFCWVGSKAKLLIVILTALLAGIMPFQGCFSPVITPPKPTGVEELDIKTVYFDNPDNPIVCAVGSKEGKSELLAVLGEKNPDGTPKEINSILYGTEDGQSIFILLGSNKLPLMAIDSGGLVIEYKDYVGSKAEAYIYDQEGNLIHEPVEVNFGNALATEAMSVFGSSKYRQVRGTLDEELAQIALDSLITAGKIASYGFCAGTIIGAIASAGAGAPVALFACASPFLDLVAYTLSEMGDPALSEFVSTSSIALDCINALEVFQGNPTAAPDFISCIKDATDFLIEELQTPPTPTPSPTPTATPKPPTPTPSPTPTATPKPPAPTISPTPQPTPTTPPTPTPTILPTPFPSAPPPTPTPTPIISDRVEIIGGWTETDTNLSSKSPALSRSDEYRTPNASNKKRIIRNSNFKNSRSSRQVDGWTVQYFVGVDWEAYPGASGYRIYKSINGEPFTLAYDWQLGDDSDTYGYGEDYSISFGSTYSYYVVAYGPDWETTPSETITISPRFLPPIFLESPPNGSTVSDSSFTLKWQIGSMDPSIPKATDPSMTWVYIYKSDFEPFPDDLADLSFNFATSDFIQEVICNEELESGYEYKWSVQIQSESSLEEHLRITSFADTWTFTYQETDVNINDVKGVVWNPGYQTTKYPFFLIDYCGRGLLGPPTSDTDYEYPQELASDFVANGRLRFILVILGEGFGNTKGRVQLEGKGMISGKSQSLIINEDDILYWTDNKIIIYPHFDDPRLEPMQNNTQLRVERGDGSGSASFGVSITPSIGRQPYGQCTWWTNLRLIETKGKERCSIGAYDNTLPIEGYVPQEYDILVWDSEHHQAFIEEVRDNGTVLISQYNQGYSEAYSEYLTGNGGCYKFSDRSSCASGYIRY